MIRFPPSLWWLWCDHGGLNGSGIRSCISRAEARLPRQTFGCIFEHEGKRLQVWVSFPLPSWAHSLSLYVFFGRFYQRTDLVLHIIPSQSSDHCSPIIVFWKSDLQVNIVCIPVLSLRYTWTPWQLGTARLKSIWSCRIIFSTTLWNELQVNQSSLVLQSLIWCHSPTLCFSFTYCKYRIVLRDTTHPSGAH